MTSVQVSVVVPTYKRTQLLSRCLKALLEMDIPSKAYEIIIVDDVVWEETRLWESTPKESWRSFIPAPLPHLGVIPRKASPPLPKN